MIRSIFATLAAFVAITAVSAQGCKTSGVGDPCIPEQEYDQTFLGFDPQEVNVESKSFQCLTRLCLVNHFRGRVTCPYGQDKTGSMLPGVDGASSGAYPSTNCGSLGTCDLQNPPNYVGPCLIPGSVPPGTMATEILGSPNDPNDAQQVQPQCIDREAANTVYCSCRCSNADGKTDDGANYCTCPDGFDCAQLINPVGTTDPDLAGAYCVKKGTEYQAFGSCDLPCDPTIAGQNCAPPSIR